MIERQSSKDLAASVGLLRDTINKIELHTVSHERTIYRSDSLAGANLPLGQSGTHGLVAHQEELVYIPNLILELYDEPMPDCLTKHGYQDLDKDGCFWVVSGTTHFASDNKENELDSAKRRFFLPVQFINALKLLWSMFPKMKIRFIKAHTCCQLPGLLRSHDCEHHG